MKVLGPPMSGSQAGVTAAIGGGSQVLRRRSMPIQPLRQNSIVLQKQTFGFLSQQWAQLTFAQQQAWVGYGSREVVTDSLGTKANLTGFQAFMQVSNLLEVSGVGFSPDPPAEKSVFVVGAFAFTAASGGSINVTPQGNGDPADIVLVAFTKPVSNGVSTPRNFVIVDFLAGDSAGTTDFQFVYLPLFGNPPAGTRIFCKLTPVSQFGQKGHSFTQYTVVT